MSLTLVLTYTIRPHGQVAPEEARRHRPCSGRSMTGVVLTSDRSRGCRAQGGGNDRSRLHAGADSWPPPQDYPAVGHSSCHAHLPGGPVPTTFRSRSTPYGERERPCRSLGFSGGNRLRSFEGVTPRNGQDRTLRVGLAFADRHLTNLRSGVAVSGAHVTGHVASIRSGSAAAPGTPIWDDYAAKGSSTTDETLAERRPACHQVGPG